MAKFTKKPVTIEASQWFKNGDHPDDYSRDHDGLEGGKLRTFTAAERKAKGWEGDIVRYYRHPDVPGDRPCEQCGKLHHDHGWIDTLEQGHRVCPGDWIITGIKGERYPCKPDIFAATYEDAALSQPVAGAVDKGPWKIGNGCRDVYSGDFVADVALRISGDFEDDAHRLRYAEWLCITLNRAAIAASETEGKG